MYQHETIRRMVRRIDDNELLLPNIQRTLVWDEEQMLFLLDSLLRGYPISTMLIWRTSGVVAARRFIRDFREGIRFSDYRAGEHPGVREFVLDGQQRLQALYISILGSYDGKRVHLDVLGKPRDDEMRYPFILAKPGGRRCPAGAVLLHDLVVPDSPATAVSRDVVRALTEKGTELPDKEQDRIQDLVAKVQQVFTSSEVITYFHADAQENPVFRNLDEVLEIFIRVNSGGTKLDWSDLLFSVVKSRWENALEVFEDFIEELNRGDAFTFDKDDVLKLCLVLTGKGAKYDLSKLRGEQGEGSLKRIQDEWNDTTESLRWVMDFLVNRTGITSQRVLRSRNALVPVVHYVYRLRKQSTKPSESDKLAMQRWLYRVLLERQFGGQAVTLLNRCAEVISAADAKDGFPEAKLLATLNLTDEPTNEAILDQGRRSPQESVLPLWVAYLQSGLTPPSFTPSHEGNRPEVDHIVPKAWLKKLYVREGKEPDGGMINNAGNYRLVERDENRGKSDSLPDVFFDTDEKRRRFRQLHMIPEETSLGESLTVGQYEEFVCRRRDTLFSRICESLRRT